MTGNSATPSGLTHAFISNGKKITDLGVLPGATATGDATASQAVAINARGQVTGYSEAVDELFDPTFLHAFLYTSGSMIDLGTLGGMQSQATAINASGQVTGYAYTTAGANHAFLYSSASMSDLGTLGGNYSFGEAINANGQVAGDSTLPGDGEAHAFLYTNFTMLDLGAAGGTSSYANAINSTGEVVGFLTTASGAMHGFVYKKGKMTDVNVYLTSRQAKLYELTDAVAINDEGQILVNGIKTSNGDSQAFLLTPRR